MSCWGVIVVAYGNPLRGDDGVGWCAAEQLKKCFTGSDVVILQRHQLLPELAEQISRAKAVIFVDAAAAQATKAHPGEVRILEISEEETQRAAASPFHHQFSPVSLLALATHLFGAKPRAFTATLNGQDFSPGEYLSPSVERAIPEFVASIEKLIRDLGRSG